VEVRPDTSDYRRGIVYARRVLERLYRVGGGGQGGGRRGVGIADDTPPGGRGGRCRDERAGCSRVDYRR
jgi:hypothetical protein